MAKEVELLDGTKFYVCQTCLSKLTRPGNLAKAAIVAVRINKAEDCEMCWWDKKGKQDKN